MRAGSGFNSGKEKETKNEMILVDLLLQHQETEEGVLRRGVVSETDEALDKVLLQLRRRLLGHNLVKSSRHHVSVSADEQKEEEDVDQPENDRESDRIRERIQKFHSEMSRIVSSADDSEKVDFKVIETVLVVSIETTMAMYQNRLNDLESARSYLELWVRDVAAYLCESDLGSDISSIEQHFLAGVAVLSYLKIKSDDSAIALRLDQIHELVDCFYSGMPYSDRGKKTIDDFVGVSYVSWVANSSADEVKAAFYHMLSVKSVRDVAVDMHSYLSNRSSEAIPPQQYSSDSWNRLYFHLNGNHSFGYKVLGSRGWTCPACYMDFDSGSQQELDNYRLVKCKNCNKFIMRIEA